MVAHRSMIVEIAGSRRCRGFQSDKSKTSVFHDVGNRGLRRKACKRTRQACLSSHASNVDARRRRANKDPDDHVPGGVMRTSWLAAVPHELSG